jgi:hypothetical protein
MSTPISTIRPCFKGPFIKHYVLLLKCVVAHYTTTPLSALNLRLVNFNPHKPNLHEKTTKLHFLPKLNQSNTHKHITFHQTNYLQNFKATNNPSPTPVKGCILETLAGLDRFL